MLCPPDNLAGPRSTVSRERSTVGRAFSPRNKAMDRLPCTPTGRCFLAERVEQPIKKKRDVGSDFSPFTSCEVNLDAQPKDRRRLQCATRPVKNNKLVTKKRTIAQQRFPHQIEQASLALRSFALAKKPRCSCRCIACKA